ncbi:hypothetical protein JDV02_004744 [Purpureocillium takamizusanense]|uniref:Uncharacterized protein n=1 Tax=Purpureocillium takamizusanense TaxID=2060973 RepID=A0A9Q8QFU7_9HYPO|nr:uncharacterized protein JDV02_004744 [Purpureocillium takamizusanense]UNI18477.1 hypothetical protein JDV02_004744 [Purpureocillium takamizusanense]
MDDCQVLLGSYPYNISACTFSLHRTWAMDLSSCIAASRDAFLLALAGDAKPSSPSGNAVATIMDPSKLTELTLLSKYIVETYAAAPLAQQPHLAVDQDGKPAAGLTLVSKFYPVDAASGGGSSSLDGSSVTHTVANYSYPRNDSAAAYTTDRPSTGKSARSSVGSNGSSPGLTDDRTISEVSFDDDYQCHTYTSRLWDSFWTQEALQQSMQQPGMPSKNHYPDTIPPLNPSRRQLSPENQGQPWPLPGREHWGRQMYPPPFRPPPPRTESPSVYSDTPARLSPETTSSEAAFRNHRPPPPPPQAALRSVRPPRPNQGVVAHQGPYRSAASQGRSVPMGPSTAKSVPLVPPLAMKARPLQLTAQQAKRPPDARPSPLHAPKPSMYNMATSSCTRLPAAGVNAPTPRRPRQHRSMTDLLNRPLPPLPEPTPEPQSVFEDDSSDEDRDSDQQRSFHLFHGRSSSDHRRPSKSPTSNSTKQGNRTLPRAPAPPRVPPKWQQQQQQPQPNCHCKKPSFEWKRQDSNVFGRVFGQRHG